MARKPYHIARQEHLGDQLDRLEAEGRLHWRWSYDQPRGRAIFNIQLPGQPWRTYDTRSAEALVQLECDTMGVVWRPVAHPGGERQRAEALRWIEERR